MRESHKGAIGWNKGKTGVYTPEQLKKMSIAQKRRFENQQVWNKGKRGIYSEEQIKKWSSIHKNISEETRRKMSKSRMGESPWNKGKQNVYTPKQLKRISEATKKQMSTPEARERSRKTILRMFESGSFPKQTNTLPERIIKEEIIKRGYKEETDFIHQYKFMNKFMCDFCFPQQKVIIEVDGDFWHANPKKFPAQNKLHLHQIRGINRDKSKSAYISKVDNGSWTLIRLWESDIKKNVSKCVDEIEKFLKRKN